MQNLLTWTIIDTLSPLVFHLYNVFVRSLKLWLLHIAIVSFYSAFEYFCVSCKCVFLCVCCPATPRASCFCYVSVHKGLYFISSCAHVVFFFIIISVLYWRLNHSHTQLNAFNLLLLALSAATVSSSTSRALYFLFPPSSGSLWKLRSEGWRVAGCVVPQGNFSLWQRNTRRVSEGRQHWCTYCSFARLW